MRGGIYSFERVRMGSHTQGELIIISPLIDHYLHPRRLYSIPPWIYEYVSTRFPFAFVAVSGFYGYPSISRVRVELRGREGYSD